jgi:hypothetical protein
MLVRESGGHQVAKNNHLLHMRPRCQESAHLRRIRWLVDRVARGHRVAIVSAWIALGSAFGGAAGAALGWTASSFVGTPLRKFFDLRGDLIRRSIEFGNVRARRKELTDGRFEAMDLSDDEIARLAEKQRIFRDIAAQMRAFAENERLAVWFVRWRYDPMKASAGLIGFSNTCDTYGPEQVHHKTVIESALRVRL